MLRLPILTLVLSAAPLAGHAQTTCDSVHTILGSFFEHEGMMFSVVATAPVTIDHLSLNLFPGTRQYSLHMRQGGYVGYTDDASAWTPLDTVTLVSGNTGFQESNTVVWPEPLGIAMSPSDTVSFFLTDQTVNGLFSFGNFTPPGNVVESDANIGITVAYALPREFGVPYGTYEWSGRVAYCLTEEQGIQPTVAEAFAVHIAPHAILVSARSVSGSYRVELRDTGGRLVHATTMQGADARIDTDGLAAGPYVLVVHGGARAPWSQLVVLR